MTERAREIARAIVAEYDEDIYKAGISLRLEHDITTALSRAKAEGAEAERAKVNTPEIVDFVEGIKLEAAHQRERWGDAHDRSKSAENWFWLVGYLAGKALRSHISGDHDKARHHTISSAAALFQWHAAIAGDVTGCGVGDDADLRALPTPKDDHGR